MLVQLTGTHLAWCRKWNDTVMSRFPVNGQNYTGLNRVDRFYVGYKGECAVWSWLESKQVDYRYTVDLRGHSAGADFNVPVDGVRRSLDVKTNGGVGYYFMMPVAVKVDADLFVGARVTDHESVIELCGWATRDEVLAMQISDNGKLPVPTRIKPFSDLRKLETLALAPDPVPRDRFTILGGDEALNEILNCYGSICVNVVRMALLHFQRRHPEGFTPRDVATSLRQVVRPAPTPADVRAIAVGLGFARPANLPVPVAAADPAGL